MKNFFQKLFGKPSSENKPANQVVAKNAKSDESYQKFLDLIADIDTSEMKDIKKWSKIYKSASNEEKNEILGLLKSEDVGENLHYFLEFIVKLTKETNDSGLQGVLKYHGITTKKSTLGKLIVVGYEFMPTVEVVTEMADKGELPINATTAFTQSMIPFKLDSLMKRQVETILKETISLDELIHFLMENQFGQTNRNNYEVLKKTYNGKSYFFIY